MTEQSFELLRAIAENSGFEALLRDMANERRPDALRDIEASHVAQNSVTAAIAFGRLDFMENLPEWFNSVLLEQKRMRKFAE